jgi:hypothetical protein
VPQTIPDEVRVKLSSTATSQYASFIYRDQSGENAVCQTMLADWSGLNNTYTLNAQNNFSITTQSVKIGFSFNSSVSVLVPSVFFLVIESGFVRVVQEYGPSSSVRSQSQMLSETWNAGTSTQSFYFDNFYDPTYWRQSPQSRSNMGMAFQPYIELQRQCKSASYFIGWKDNQMGITFNGDKCGAMIGDPEFGNSCTRKQAYLPLPLSGEFRRLIFGPDVVAGMAGLPQTSVEESVSGYTTNAVFRAQFSVDSVSLVYGDRVVDGFSVNQLP